MKVIASAVFMSAMLLASVGSASATSYLQASSTEEQLASDTKPKVVTMNSTDASKNIKQEKGVIRFNETGAFFVMAAAPVGGKAKGLVRMWMRLNGKDIDNSNTEQLIADPSFTAVLVCQGVAEVKRGDKIEVVFSGSEVGVGLVVKKPTGEPVVPSVIFSGWRID
jgi:2-keto-4-pentenoate hydratase/2-oxohepta-3-ene-1,7-dioic acid hydratase in catechol pathway